MSIHQAIQFLLNRTPDWLQEIQIEDDGQGAFLALWNVPEQRPEDWYLADLALIFDAQPTPFHAPTIEQYEETRTRMVEHTGTRQKIDPETGEPMWTPALDPATGEPVAPEVLVPVEEEYTYQEEETYTVPRLRATGWTHNREAWLDAEIRPERNRLLTSCDWTVLPDSPLTEEQRTAWRTYRQALRDLTETIQPENPAWPTSP